MLWLFFPTFGTNPPTVEAEEEVDIIVVQVLLDVLVLLFELWLV